MEDRNEMTEADEPQLTHSDAFVKSIIQDGDTIIRRQFTSIILRRGRSIVKAGKFNGAREAAAMKYIADNSNIPVPKLYSLVADPETGNSILTMEVIEGQTLATIWSTISTAEKVSIVAQLRAVLVQLHELEGAFIGSIDGSAAVDYKTFPNEGGPFSTEDEFNSFLLSNTIKLPGYWKDTALRMGQTNHRILFAHCDLAMENIMIRDSKVVAVLDWELAGWYPEYWEFVKFFFAGYNEEYTSRLLDAFPTRYEAELATNFFIRFQTKH